jgi:hypothetical protein
MKIIQWIKGIWLDYKRKKRYKEKLRELKKRDPFTYNH